MWLVVTRRELWKYIWIPMSLAAIVYIGVLALGWFALPSLVDRFLPDGSLKTWLENASRGLIAAAWLFLAGPVYLFFSGIFSSLMWDRLSERVEIICFGHAPQVRVGCIQLISDSIARILFAVMVLGLMLLFSWAGILVAIIGAGLLSLFDFSACAFIRRGVTFPSQIGPSLRLPGTFAFTLLCGALSLLPFVFVLLLPGMVAGGTILCAEGSRRQ